ncbi:dynein axonemal heavy chain 6-like [Littorina saxatilis]|uniref:dynein axonemal heavy chain 6-like n=1 Tax=Littorina saxatilis TaxID=31220 RepID=UPI0038B4AE72
MSRNISRGESRISHLSQCSESTVLNQDFAEVATLEQDLFNKEHSANVKVTRFQAGLEPIKATMQNDPLAQNKRRMGHGGDLAAKLKERLYDRPENSGALNYVRNQSLGRARPLKLAPLERPLSGKQNQPQSEPFRTSLFKKDYIQRQQQMEEKYKKPSGLQTILDKQMSNIKAAEEQAKKGADDLSSVSDFGKADRLQDVDMEELFSDSSSPTKTGTKKRDIGEDNMSTDESVSTSKDKDSVASAQATAKPELPKPAKLPDIERRHSSASIVLPQPVETKTRAARPSSAVASRGMQSGMKRAASGKMDMSKVLSYLKKNKYDDRVPDNDSVFDNMVEMRQRLGWVTDIPRHGPDCKKDMFKLGDKPLNEKEALKAKDDDGQFLYCLPRNQSNPRARYNPYDLQVVSPNTARGRPIYWTVSASYITMCDERVHHDDQTSTTPALWWLWERRLFYMVFEFPVFVKFRLWKAFQLWKYSIRHHKNSGNKAVLYKTLFVANEVLQGALVHIQSLCESAKGATKDGSRILLVDLDFNKTLTLAEFQDNQEKQCDKAFEQLTTLREKVIELVWESCATVAEMEGITQGIREDSSTRKVTIMAPKSVSTALVGKGQKAGAGAPADATKKEKTKPNGKPLYAEIAEWRKILARLACFLRLVDYTLQELMRHLVFSSVQQLLDHLVNSYHAPEEEELDEADGQDGPSQLTTGRGSFKFVRRSSPTNSDLSFLSDTQGFRKKKKDVTATGYVIPHYDFDRVEETEGPPDIDEVLDEIRQRDVVEDVIFPVFYIDLILNVPSKTRTGSSKGKAGSQGSKVTGSPSKKGVTFQEESSDESETESESDDERSDDEGMHTLSEEDEEDVEEEERAGGQSHFAYPENGTRSKDKHERAHSTKSFVSLSPSSAEFDQSVQHMIGAFEVTVSKFVPMLREPRLSVFYSPPKHDLRLHFDEEEEEERREMQKPWPDLDLILHDDPRFQRLLTGIQSYMDMEMELLDQYITNYHQFCQMVDQSKEMKVEESMAKRAWTTDDFNQVLAAYTEMLRRMGKMVMSRRVAMVMVRATDFCDSATPYPKKIEDDVHHRLPLLANKRCDDLLTIIKGASRRLDQFPATVEEFVDHLSFLGKMSTELPALEKEYNIVNKMFTIARDYNVDQQPEHLALYKTLAPSFQHLKSTILYCEAKKDDNIGKFSSDLDTLIHNIRFKLMELKSRVQDPDLLHEETMAVSALETIQNLQEEVQGMSVRARSYASYQERFGSSLSQKKIGYYPDLAMMDKKSDASAQDIQTDLSEIERDLMLRRLLWQSLEEWTRLVDEWTATPFDSINVESLQKNVNKFTQTVFMLEKGLPHNEVLPQLKEKVMDFKQGMPVITSLRNPSLRQRHWDAIQKIINKVISRDKSFTLGNLLEMNIFKAKEKIQDISTTASNEATLELMLQKIVDLWQSTDFRLVPHAGRDTLIIYGADDIMAQLEESQVTVGTIRGSRYVGPIKAQVEEWERKLLVFSRTLDEWLNCQRNWLYLEQIFSIPDIQRQLPSEFKMFSFVDKSWKDIMRRVEDRPNALRSAITPGTLDTLQQANASLEKIHKCLEDYLETKRFVFPRFYFLSNDELLDILAQSKDPNAVQPHLGKCFGNIKQLDIRQLPRQPPTVKSIMSAENEVINMPRNVRARGPVEQWLGTVEAGMFETVKKHLKLGLADWLDTPQVDWVLKHPGQVVLTVTQIHFNKNVLAALEQTDVRKALMATRDDMMSKLSELAGLVLNRLVSFQRQSIEALLTITVHDRDIVLGLIGKRVKKPTDFEWKKQLRYEWDETTNNCQVRQSNAAFQYGYEYLGCSPRLVITPLTDRCYLTLTGAMNLNLGASPAGPAGTGKTETVKDLAKAMGKQCVVFNCSEGLDYKMLGKFFSGLAQSGSWCCFDEFNRIDIEVLSVVAQQILTIKSAKDSNSLRFMFEARDIKLNISCAYFITMNPTYAGRVDLPDNLKSLFRPVAMMVPDYPLIAEIMLFSEGFVNARSLSQKIVNLYQLASKQLSQQDHYDFGMRAIKSVLVMAGHGRRHAQMKDGVIVKQLSDEDESHVLIHSLRDANLPKYLAEDVPLFESILADLFPGVTPPEQDQGALEKAISMSIRDLGLQHWPSQIEKVRQLHSQVLVRHGVMLVGPTGGGKTAVRSILQKALILLPMLQPQDGAKHDLETKRQSIFMNRGKKGHVETFVVNPKCVKLGELYGETDPHTFEWSDGLIATATRRFAKDTASPIPSMGDDGRAARPLSTMTDVSTATHLTATTHKSETTPSHDDDDGTVSAFEVEGERRDLSDGPITDWRWIVLDGPVDTLWVENLNTVLDDSKVLCLASGERISLSPGMRLLFEVDNLSQASPATISRCAMVYMDPVDLGWRPFVKTWLNRLPREMPESGKNHLQALFFHAIDKGVRFMRKHSRFLFLPVPEMSVIATLCNVLNAYISFLKDNGGFGSADKEESTSLQAQTPDQDGRSSRSSSRGPSGRSSRTKRASRKRTTKLKEEEGVSETAFGSKSSREAKKYFLEKHPSQLTQLLGKLFVFSFTWSMGGILRRQEDADEDESVNRRGGDRQEVDVDICNEFDNFVREMFEVEPPVGVRLPTGNKSIFSYFIDMETGNFVGWDVLVPSTKSLIEKGAVITIGESMGMATQHQKGQGREAEIVPTVDIVRFSFLAGLLLLNKHPVLLTGDSGVGKTAIIANMLKELEKEGGTSYKPHTVLGTVFNYSEKQSSLLENISSLTSFGEGGHEQGLDVMVGMDKPRAPVGLLSTVVQMSAQTSSHRLQSQIKLRLIKKGRDSMGAPKGRRVMVFVDDLNMPTPEEYGAQPPLELLRQFLELGGFYDTKKLVWKDILDVNVVAACGPPGGGRNPISPRLLKNFCTLALPQPSTRSLQHIYQVQLGRFLQDGEFMPEVLECLFPLVSAAVAVYYRMGAVMLPTPTKSHYTFNIRDLSKVIQGLLQANENVVIGKENCAQLFAHEATRIFHDRLVSPEDRRTFFEILSDNLHDYFKVRWSADKLISEGILFGDFFDMEETSAQRIYRPMIDQTKLTRVLEDYYMRYNFGEKSNQLVFFRDAVEHVVRAARVFRQPGGHLMLVGLDGTGKSTVVHLASYIALCEIMRLKLHKSYDLTEFREDLKAIFIQSGVKGVKTVFLLADSDIVKEAFLEDINCILNSGEVPDLFDNEELDGITMDLKADANAADVPDTRAAVYQFFIQRVRQHLHVVLTMSPAGDKFRQRCRMNPALINCCTIDWYDEWSEEAMLSVAKVFFSNTEFIADPEYDIEELKERVAQICVDMHKSVVETGVRYWAEVRRHLYATPSSYMELIRLYARMLRDNKRDFVSNRQRLQIGLSTLSDAYNMVGDMQEELLGLGPVIVQKAKDTEQLLQQLEKDQEAVEQVRQIVESEEDLMKKETQIVQNFADECHNDLASVLPALQQAIMSLETLDKASISELRVYSKPPPLVETVMSAVCVLFQRKPDWPTAKLMLGDQGFLRRLLQFDKNAVPDKVFSKLKKYSKTPDFKADTVGKVSVACRSLCMWVLAMEHYHDVYKMVKPKQARVEEAQEALKLAQDSLAKKQNSLRKIQKHLQLIQKQYQDSVNQREALQQRQVTTGLRLQRAAVLISALEDEEVRWAESVKVLDGKLKGLVGNTLVSAAAVAYLGPLTLSYRQELVAKWVHMLQESQVPISHRFDLIHSMSEANEIMKWYNHGLPRDKHSTENAIFVKKARKWPLFIDPQFQAASWVKEMEGYRLKIVTATDPNMMRTLETAVKVGDPVLIKDVGEEIDPALRPIIMQETTRRGGQQVIKLGDTEIEFNTNFRLYMATGMANPHFLPGVFIQVNIINFTVTFDGLQEQLLSVVVRQERPQLESQRRELLESIAGDKQLLRDLEDKSLSLLQKTEGHILDDQDLVETLQQSKGKNQEISARVSQSEVTEKSINSARKKYLPVARRGAVLYFVLAELASMDVMYQYSLSWFQRMFASCISNSSADTASIASSAATAAFGSGVNHTLHDSMEDLESNMQVSSDRKSPDMSDEELLQHLQNMTERLTHSIYRIVSVGLFSGHQLTFSFLLCASIMRANTQGVDPAKTAASSMMSLPTSESEKKESKVKAEGSSDSGVEGAGDGGVDKEEVEKPGEADDPPSGENTGGDSGSDRTGLASPSHSVMAEDLSNDLESSSDGLGVIQDTEWHIFLQGNVMASMADEELLKKHNGLTPLEQLEVEGDGGERQSARYCRAPEWVTDNTWRQCQYLDASLPVFAGLCRSLRSSPQQWQAFRASPDCFLLMEAPFVAGPEEEEKAEITAENTASTTGSGTATPTPTPILTLTGPTHKMEVKVFPWDELSKFQQLVLVRVLRSDMLVAAMARFVQGQLGEKYLSTSAFDLKEIYEGSTAKSPLIFILSPGCDPTSQLMRFAKEQRGSTTHLDMISLGRGQGPRAEELISKAQILKSRWVFLQNCHLAASWMPRLQNIVEKFNSSSSNDVDPQFRLWLSSRPDPSFPISILQTGIKMTVESPRGLKANLLKTFGSSGAGIVSEKMYEEGSSKPGWHTLLYGLCLFNAVIHERKKFGSLGYNIPYEFNDSDLEVAILKLQMLMEGQDDIPWEALRYLTGEVTYGGRVTDDFDRRCLLSLLNKFYCPESLTPGYCYSSSQMYQPVPETLPFNMVLSFVEELPAEDSPDVFGMTYNAEKACREMQASEIIHTLVDVQPGITHSKGGAQQSDDEVVLELAAEIQKRLPPAVEGVEEETTPGGGSTAKHLQLTLKGLVNRDVNTKGMDKEKVNALYSTATATLGNNALVTVLRQETVRFNHLLEVIHSTLVSLTLAIKGEIIMSDQLEEAYNALFRQEIPAHWKAAAYESNKPLGSWVKDLDQRVDFFSSWAEILCRTIERQFRQVTRQVGQPEVETDEPMRTQPNSFWLPGFFFPQGFLTAVLQNHARKVGISVDSLVFDFHVLKYQGEVSETARRKASLVIHDMAYAGLAPPEDGVRIFGLHLDGASWDPDAHCLRDSHTDQRFHRMPEIHFKPVEMRQSSTTSSATRKEPSDAGKEKAAPAHTYECPLYRTSARAGMLSSTGHSTNFVMSVNLPSEQLPDFWILRGVAMLCQLDE